jgi:dTDP-4-amino-4,6-dideoxy-D-galactose acyltransferase
MVRHADRDAAEGVILEWDSAFWNIRTGRAIGERLTSERGARLQDWCIDEQVVCLYFLADPDDWETVIAAEAIGLTPVDVRVSLDRSLSGLPSTPQRLVDDAAPHELMLRMHEPADIDVLEHIAGISYMHSRFFFDRRFPRDRCRQLYETWIRRSCEGYADAVLVAALGEDPVGFISCHLDNDRSAGSIGLVGVSPRTRGLGVGSLLVNGALHWFAHRDARSVSVVTQGRNVAAQRLYQRCGFLTSEVRLWYHGWYPK